MECNVKETQLKMDIDKNIAFSLIDVNLYKVLFKFDLIKY